MRRSLQMLPFISITAESGTSFPSVSSRFSTLLLNSSSVGTITTAFLMKPSKLRILRLWAAGYTLVCVGKTVCQIASISSVFVISFFFIALGDIVVFKIILKLNTHQYRCLPSRKNNMD